jgi:hypothetical protein
MRKLWCTKSSGKTHKAILWEVRKLNQNRRDLGDGKKTGVKCYSVDMYSTNVQSDNCIISQMLRKDRLKEVSRRPSIFVVSSHA